MLAILRKPSAFLPVAMSLAALMTVLFHVALFGVGGRGDEGAAAHLFQLLMVFQVPIVAFFAMIYPRRSPRLAVQVLALQAGTALLAIAPVFFLGL